MARSNQVSQYGVIVRAKKMPDTESKAVERNEDIINSISVVSRKKRSKNKAGMITDAVSMARQPLKTFAGSAHSASTRWQRCIKLVQFDTTSDNIKQWKPSGKSRYGLKPKYPLLFIY